MTILGLAKSFKTMNRPGPTITLLGAFFSERIKDKDVKFLHNLYSSLQFMLSTFGINIFDSFDL